MGEAEQTEKDKQMIRKVYETSESLKYYKECQKLKEVHLTDRSSLIYALKMNNRGMEEEVQELRSENAQIIKDSEYNMKTGKWTRRD